MGLLVHKDDSAWVVQRFLGDTQSNGDIAIIPTDSVLGFKNRFSSFAMVIASSVSPRLLMPLVSMDVRSVYW